MKNDPAQFGRVSMYQEDEREHEMPFPAAWILLLGVAMWLAIVWFAVKLATLAGWL